MSRSCSVACLVLAVLGAMPFPAVAQSGAQAGAERAAGAPLKGVDVKLGKEAAARPATSHIPSMDAGAKDAAVKPGAAPGQPAGAQSAQGAVVKSKSNISNN